VLIVMPRALSSGALSMLSKGLNVPNWYLSCNTLVMAAVSVVLPWSIWPMVPMLTWGFVLTYFAFAICLPPISFNPHPGSARMAVRATLKIL
jgi:hypothetical protein